MAKLENTMNKDNERRRKAEAEARAMNWEFRQAKDAKKVRVRNDKTRQDMARQDKTYDKTRQDKTQTQDK